MASQSEVLGLHGYSFQSASTTSPTTFNHLDYSYTLHYNHDVTSTDLAVLANQFSRHSIRTNEWVASQQQSQSQHTASLPLQQNVSNCSITARQAQRQENTLLQCQVSHARQLSILLEQMITSGEQCNVCNPGQQIIAEAPAWEEDETMGEMDDEDDDLGRPALTYRRAMDLSGQQGYVNKTIRVRKRRRGESSESSR
jgi:hypothetical protein